MENRAYQIECEEAVLSNWKTGVRHQLVVMATGTGKTVIFSKLIKRIFPMLQKGEKVLVFAHREELVDQAISLIKKVNSDLKVGKEMANDYADKSCDVVVSCVASIGRSGSTRLSRFGQFGLVICDEAHHSIAQTYLNVFETVGVLKKESTCLLVGFTATPKRKNRKRATEQKTLEDGDLVSLKDVYTKIVYNYPIRKAIEEGWLVPLRGYSVKTETSLDGIKTTAGDFQQDELSNAVNTDRRNKQIVDAWEQYGENRQTVGFTVDISHAKNLAKAFRDRNHKAEAIWGTDPERSEKLKRHKSGDIRILLNAQVLTEGYDDWTVSCIISAAPTQSSTKYTQEIGRGTRIAEGTGNLLHALKNNIVVPKLDCIIIDVVDNYRKNTLASLPILVGLNPRFNLKGSSVITAAKKIEEAQDKFPGISFAHITDTEQIKAYVEKIDLFADPYSEEVKELSKLSWLTMQDGSFMIGIPESKNVTQQGYGAYQHEKWLIRQNELSEYDVFIKSRHGEKKVGEYSTLEIAFREADSGIRRFRSDRVSPLLREANWSTYPASSASKRYLAKLAKGRAGNWCLCDGPEINNKCSICGGVKGITQGLVSTAINKLKAGK